jgi:hypothetical protein
MTLLANDGALPHTGASPITSVELTPQIVRVASPNGKFAPQDLSPLLQCMSPLLALSGRAGQRALRQLSGEKRTRHFDRAAAASDPSRHFATTICCVHNNLIRM